MWGGKDLKTIHKEGLYKLLLWMSGIALMFMVMASRKSALYACIGMIVIWTILMWKTVVGSKVIAYVGQAIRVKYVVASFLCSSGFGLNFYGRWKAWDKYLALVVAFALICLTIPLITVVFAYTIDSVIQEFTILQPNGAVRQGGGTLPIKKSFFVLLGIILIGMSALLRANFNYRDDIARVAYGAKGMTYFSRFLSEAFSTWIHMDTYLMDVSPLTQGIAAVLLAMSGMMILYILTERIHFGIWEIVAVVIVALNPYFLQCLSFKYDAPYMAFSIFAAIFPLLYRKRTLAYVFLSLVGTVLVCISYQAASGIYPILVIMVALQMWIQKEHNRDIGSFVGSSILGYVSGMISFKLLMMNPASTYASNELPGIREFIPNYWKHLLQYYTTIKSDFKLEWCILVICLLISYVIGIVIQSEQSKFLTFIASMASLAMMGVLCFGMYPALTAPIYDPRAMYGFGTLLALVGVRGALQGQLSVLKVPAIVMSWSFFVFAFAYGNALVVQNAYEEFRVQQIVGDLAELECLQTDKEMTVQISGSVGYAQVLRNMPQDYQMMNRLVSVRLEGGYFGRRLVGFYYNLKNVNWIDSVDLSGEEFEVLKDTMYHTIRGNDTYISVELK
jgi:hypothetical protein